ncbi:MAG: hypothetical protein JWL81_3108 [Verrucomicrobiales bacterium]|nr:hypothetical protein [Verrucomicrobiales bacterium]
MRVDCIQNFRHFLNILSSNSPIASDATASHRPHAALAVRPGNCQNCPMPRHPFQRRFIIPALLALILSLIPSASSAAFAQEPTPLPPAPAAAAAAAPDSAPAAAQKPATPVGTNAAPVPGKDPAEGLPAPPRPRSILRIWLARLFVPMAALEGRFHHGYFSALQIPLILLITISSWMVIRRSHFAKSWRVFLTTCVAVLSIAATNAWAMGHPRDTAKDFPIAQALSRTDFTHPPFEADLITRVGAPTAKQLFTLTDPLLPKSVAENMKAARLNSALIYAYREQAWGREMSLYVIIDPASKKLQSAVVLNAPYTETISWPK